MEILIFVLRTAFLVLIYVFVYIVFIHIVRDLRDPGGISKGETLAAREDGGPGRMQAGVKRCQGAGLLKVDAAPEDYGMYGAEFALAGAATLGRGPENDVILPDRYASNQHAAIYLRNGQYWLEDLGSKNGTFLNGKPVNKPAVLAHGDQIRIGDLIFSFARWDNAVEYDHRVRTGKVEE